MSGAPEVHGGVHLMYVFFRPGCSPTPPKHPAGVEFLCNITSCKLNKIVAYQQEGKKMWNHWASLNLDLIYSMYVPCAFMTYIYGNTVPLSFQCFCINLKLFSIYELTNRKNHQRFLSMPKKILQKSHAAAFCSNTYLQAQKKYRDKSKLVLLKSKCPPLWTMPLLRSFLLVKKPLDCVRETNSMYNPTGNFSEKLSAAKFCKKPDWQLSSRFPGLGSCQLAGSHRSMSVMQAPAGISRGGGQTSAFSFLYEGGWGLSLKKTKINVSLR
jgi:hypothetical protein